MHRMRSGKEGRGMRTKGGQRGKEANTNNARMCPLCISPAKNTRTGICRATTVSKWD